MSKKVVFWYHPNNSEYGFWTYRKDPLFLHSFYNIINYTNKNWLTLHIISRNCKHKWRPTNENLLDIVGG